ncbi:hypothetical protein L6164_001238 [Bauhinia variegata]|uniref:Uncharacterized protein n=1 Tax=Bauhinia variegata TaxID=167791 RepID=A0ACB9Q916_BAUVA|nr:hypothetical protein L6164_001238 [Bauhinia variegata]
MATENFSIKIPTETLAIKFTGKNYEAWKFQFKMLLKGKDLWSDIDGSSRQWETKDAQFISWILGSIEAHVMNNLRSFGTAKKKWDYLKLIYYQDNTARRF